MSLVRWTCTSDKSWLVALSQLLACWLQRWVIEIQADNVVALGYTHTGICTYMCTCICPLRLAPVVLSPRGQKQIMALFAPPHPPAAMEIDTKEKGDRRAPYVGWCDEGERPCAYVSAGVYDMPAWEHLWMSPLPVTNQFSDTWRPNGKWTHTNPKVHILCVYSAATESTSSRPLRVNVHLFCLIFISH